MIHFNLQWFMYPCIVAALYCLYIMVVGTYYLFFGREIENLVGMYLLVTYSIPFFMSVLLGFLFWKAFK